MKKIVLFLAALNMAIFAQEPEKIAVYVSGASEAGVNKSLGGKLAAAIAQNSGYAEIGDMEAFYNELSGKPDGNISQVAQTAKRHEASVVCAVSLTEAFGAYSISARMIKTADSQVIKTALLEHSLKSFEDLASVSNRLAAQFIAAQPANQDLPAPAAVPAEAPEAAPAPEAPARQCEKTYNINELVFKIQEAFPKLLKDCSAKLAKDMALASSPFGKKSVAPEPKSFMTQCAVDGVKEKLPQDFPSLDKAIGEIHNFTQSLINSASAGGALDPKKLIKAVDEMRIDELLNGIKKLAAENLCIVDELYEAISAIAPASGDKGGYAEDEGGKKRRKVPAVSFPLSFYRQNTVIDNKYYRVERNGLTAMLGAEFAIFRRANYLFSLGGFGGYGELGDYRNEILFGLDIKKFFWIKEGVIATPVSLDIAIQWGTGSSGDFDSFDMVMIMPAIDLQYFLGKHFSFYSGYMYRIKITEESLESRESIIVNAEKLAFKIES